MDRRAPADAAVQPEPAGPHSDALAADLAPASLGGLLRHRSTADSSATVLALQRRVGNRATTEWLARSEWPGRGGSATLARFVGSEHKALGDTTGASVDIGNGVVLSWGDIVALAGDEYATVEELMDETKTEEGKARLRAALEHDGIPGSVAATLPAPTPDQVKAQQTKFITLAMSNTSHFPDGGAALGAWANHHAAAIETAVIAGLANDAAGMNVAYANEAFGQHFLTDCFSGGHIRTPRTQIVDWYKTTFAPRVTGPLLANLRTRLIEALVREASPQTSLPEWKLRDDISERVNPGIDRAIATAGGMTALTEFVGLGVAGAISGAMHDQEGATGVMVASDDHPDPWRAFGDAGLKKSPVSDEQAKQAIAAAKAQVDAAFLIGQEEAVVRDTVQALPPARVHFGFNSSTLTAEARSALTMAAAYMAYRPTTVVDVTGHTDPIGSDEDNVKLGKARADAVVAALTGGGVDAGRIHADTMGKRALVTTNPKRYAENRRADLGWATSSSGGSSTGPEPTDEERATQRAMAAAQVRADPALVTRFVPRPVEERGGSGNAPLPEWHWGRLEAPFRAVVDDWIRSMVGTKLEDALDGIPDLDPQSRTVPVTGTVITVHPRDRAKEIVRALMANPTAELGNLMGEAPGT